MTDAKEKSQYPYGVSKVEYSKEAIENLHLQQGKILEYLWIMKKKGLAEKTIKTTKYLLEHLSKLGAKMLDPASVETVLATETFTPASKLGRVKAYQGFAKTFKLEFHAPKSNYRSTEPFIPLESEIDQMIDNMTKTGKVFCQIAKDTGARAGEISKIKWEDVDTVSRTIVINRPLKNGNTRIIDVSDKTISLINTLKKNHGEYLFNPTGVTLRSTFTRKREKLAKKFDNPRLLRIHFHTFRHFKATMEYARTLDLVRTQRKLGHRNIQSTLRYTHLIDFTKGEYEVKRPKTSKEEDDLIEQGYQFVRYDEIDKRPIYRRRK
jgi:integrase